MMYKVKTRNIRFVPAIGLGYWTDVYKAGTIGVGGISHNLVVFCVKIQWGYLLMKRRMPGEKKDKHGR